MDEERPVASPPPRRRRRVARFVARALGLLAIVVVVAIAAGWWLLGRETTLQRIVAAGERALHGALTIEGVTGSLYDHVAFRRLVFRSKTTVVTVEDGALRYRLEPFARRFAVDEAHATRLVVETIASSDEKTTEPDTLELPAAMRVDTLGLDAVRLDAIVLVDDTKGGARTEFGPAELRARYDRDGLVKRWTVDRVAIATPWGKASGTARVDATKPFAIEAALVAEGRVDDVPYRAPLVVSGTLGDLVLASEFTVSDPTHAPLAGHADACVLPFRDQPIEKADIHVAGIAPKRWKATLPEADLTIDATIRPAAAPLQSGGAHPFTGRLHASNAQAGSIDAGRIPVAALDAEVAGDSVAVAVDALRADLGRAGRLEGRGRWAFAADGASSFDGVVRALDLRAIDGALVATRFDGPIVVGRHGDALRVEATLADGTRSVRVKGGLAERRVTVDEAAVALGASRASLSGTIALDRDRPFEVAGSTAHLDAADFGDFPKSDVNATFRLAGTLGAAGSGNRPAEVHATSDVRIDPSRVAGRAIVGSIAGGVDAEVGGPGAAPGKKKASPVVVRRVEGAHVALAVGADRLTVDGDFGRPQDRLRFALDAPRLADVGLGLAGALRADGTIAGTTTNPEIDFTIAGDDLRDARAATARPPSAASAPTGTAAVAKPVSSGGWSVATLRASGHLAADAAGRADLDVALSNLRDGGATAPLVRNATLKVVGTRAAHHAALAASSDRFDLAATADGGVDGGDGPFGGWRGTLATLSNRGSVPFTLAGITTVVAGRDRVEIGAATVRFEEGELDLDRFVLGGGKVSTAGRATGIPLSLATGLSRNLGQRLSTSLKLGAAWDLRVADTIDGRLDVHRESGGVRFLAQPRFDIDPDRLEVVADIAADRVVAKVAASGGGLGRIDGSVETRLSRRDGAWGIAGDAPLVVAGDVDVPDVRWLARLAGVAGLDAQGALKMTLAGKGTVAKPALAGHANGEAIRVRWPEQGVDARDGRFDLDFDGDRVLLRDATFAGGDGKLAAHGELRLDDRAASGAFDVALDRFQAVARTDRTMVVSGTGSVKFGAAGIDVVADVKADRGSLQLVERRGPTMSSDVIVVGRETDAEAAAPDTRVRFDVKFDMGDDFKVKGAGFDGTLGGTIRLAGVGADLRAVGTVAVRDGTYEGYGQKLTITKGNLIFSGPIDNPALDIVAVRKNLAVEAGITVSGTALAPQAKLTSTPSVPDTEKLSWLILGHGLSASNKSDYALLTTAAAGLLGPSDSTSLQSRIAATLGVDEIGVSSASSTGGTTSGLLTVGKQISSKLRVTFEQGLSRAATYVKLRYAVYNHIDLQVQTGTESGLDVFYTFSFD